MKTEGNTLMVREVLIFFLVALTGFFSASFACLAAGALDLQLASDTIDISTFYNGTTLEVSGTAPADTDVVLEVSGAKKDVHLKEKGKVLGILWMNKTDVSLENAPANYMVYTPDKPVDALLNPETSIGYQSLVKDIVINPATEDKAFIFGEYVKLMEKSGVYAIYQGRVKYGPAKGGTRTFAATLVVPPKMSTGTYQVRGFALRNGTVVDRAGRDLTVRLQGFPAMIYSLAYDHSLLFGIMAVVIAIGAGLGIGALFKGGGGAH
jgi:hypothetical protein